MSDNLFDNFLKEKLDNHTSPVAADMWERIQARKEKERRGGWWTNSRGTAVALIGALMLTGIFVARQYSDEPMTAKEGVTGNSQTVSSPALGNSYGNKPNVNDNKSPDNDNHQQTPSSSINNQQPASSEKLNDASQQSDVSSTGNFNKDYDSKTNHFDDEINKRNQLNARATRKHLPEIGSTNKLPLPGRQTFDNATGKKILSNIELGIDQQYQSINSLQFLAGKKASANFSLQQNLEQLRGIRLTDCPSAFGNRTSNWYVETYVAPDYSLKSTKTNGLSDEYLKRKDSTESYRGAFTAGIRLSKSIGEHLLVKTGLQYSQINEKFNYRTENERRLTTVVTIRTIIRGNNPGDTIMVRDTSIVEQIGYRIKTTHNRFRSIDIPVIASYEWGNDNWKGAINAGLIFNVRSWQQGDMLDTSYTPVAFDKAASPVFKHNIGLGLYAGVSLIKPVSNRLDVFAEPYMRYNISNMTNSSSPFNQKFNIIGINFGVRYKIAGNRQH